MPPEQLPTDPSGDGLTPAPTEEMKPGDTPQKPSTAAASSQEPEPNEPAAAEEAEGKVGEEQAPDPRAAIPETAEAYAVNLPDDAKAALGLTDGDPLVKGLSEFAKANGKPQGWLDDVLEGAAALHKAGLLGAPFDPAAEAAALGENAAGRRSEVETFGNALKDRGELDADEHEEFMATAATAAGIRLIEKLRGRMGDNGRIDPPSGDGQGGKDAALAKAREMRADARYETDPKFRKQADAAYEAAFK